MTSNFDCAIIGSGPAGMTAAIYLKRAQVNFVLIERSAPGGQLLKTGLIENYPGFVSIDGAFLAANMYEQITNLEIEIKYANVSEIKQEQDIFILDVGSEIIKARTVIIATGRQPKMLGLNQEEKLVGKGISYCATCDGALYRDKIVGVVGGGDTAIEEALYLSKICKKVYIFNRSEALRANKLVTNEIQSQSNIELFYNSVIDTLISEGGILKGVKTKDDKYYELNGLFIFIGQIPNTIIYKNEDIKLDNGYIVVDENMETTLKGVYACGDCIKKDYYQISTAIGEATIAALQSKKSLSKKS